MARWEAADPGSLGGEFIAKHGIEEYRREYEAGWRASARASGSGKYDSGNYTYAWEDGYLDRAAGRKKWHLLRCPDHDRCGEG